MLILGVEAFTGSGTSRINLGEDPLVHKVL